jgi:mono/diheme cytochrome c family protein
MRYSILACVPVLVLSTACHDSAHPESAAPHTVTSQVQLGKEVFAANCARCHGDAGEGKKGPPLVGPNALPLDPRPDQKVRKQPFHTALDVAQFVTHNMPPDADDRKKLRESDYWAVLAFDLNANGVALKEPVGLGNASSIVLHP